jgi:thiamine biosynthesis lipoprotein
MAGPVAHCGPPESRPSAWLDPGRSCRADARRKRSITGGATLNLIAHDQYRSSFADGTDANHGSGAANFDEDVMMARFRAMNTEVTVLAPYVHPLHESELAQRVERVFAQAERTFSRFRTDSELTQLNSGDGPMRVSPTLFDALQRARMYWQMSEGWFDPTIASALIAAGYDRSFAPGALDRAEVTPPVSSAACFGDVVLHSASRTVTLPAVCRLDCGGFIKGWAVDQAVQLLPSVSAVDAGGDAMLRGPGPDGLGWLVEVEDPFAPGHVLATLSVQDRAVATSGSNRHRWRVGARDAHHLIDPHTRRPGETDLAQVTVFASSAELADVLAKTAFLRGFHDGSRFLERFGQVSGVFVLNDGRARLVGDLEMADAA